MDEIKLFGYVETRQMGINLHLLQLKKMKCRKKIILFHELFPPNQLKYKQFQSKIKNPETDILDDIQPKIEQMSFQS